MVEPVQEIILILSFLLPVTALYVQGQAYFNPAIKIIGIQSLLIGIISFIYYFLTENVEFIILGGIIFLTRAFLTPYILLKTVRFKEWDRERVKVLSSFVVNLAFFFSATLLVVYAVFVKVIPTEYEGVIMPMTLFFQGLFLIASRKSTTAHILGYIELENSLVVLGISLIPPPILIDATVFLDVLALVVISSVIIVEKRDHEPVEELRG
ncbi:hypothetical protein L3N51_00509 [Metallosphaera sp. J1]|uniref:hydrogenase n=1 Tax=Metallosphaera TaxID=41980 RepID=UPI001EE124C2|nr:hydrogenase [Metallosphaera javensis (ex Hofmann et al. 2022)]MCG3108228.1 hypothetical protein [Metallosphaera javensis (ex Hofmann et al. 2022)]BCS93900.1 MAG: hydrogenase-4 component E [Metallosphaera javensis (ex Sakai et al. 2022)]